MVAKLLPVSMEIWYAVASDPLPFTHAAKCSLFLNSVNNEPFLYSKPEKPMVIDQKLTVEDV